MSEPLPIHEVIPEIKERLQKHNILILQAPPGAGKSTILPVELLKENWLGDNKILMLEPRRLAAKSVATRLASLLQEELGETVGFRIRFESKISSKTKLEVLTEGMLSSRLQQNSSLEGIGLIVFDEFHERSLHADLALALCLDIQNILRPDLRILIMSATLDGEKISSMLGNAPIVTSSGRQFPIKTIYLGNDSSMPLVNRVSGTIKIALKEQQGDILVFLPGKGEIEKVKELLTEQLPDNLVVCPLYGDLSFVNQQLAILPHPSGFRKIVLATSIAETSLTIQGVKVVIDSGLSRVPVFDPKTSLTKLETIKVSQDAADQRSGRAGRLGPGISYRLWSEGTQYQLEAARKPEIAEADLVPMLLELAHWGIVELTSLTWLTIPPDNAISQGRDLLIKLQAVNDQFRITSKGKEMVVLPTHPRLAHLLLEGKNTGIIQLACDVAAILEEKDPLPNEQSADLSIRVEILRKWRKKEFVSAEKNSLERIERLASNWRRIFKCDVDNSQFLSNKVGFLLASAYPERLARQKDNDLQRYRLSNGKIVKLKSQQDALDREKWLAVAHLDAGHAEGKIFLAAPFNPEDLSHLMIKKESIYWDYQKAVLVSQTELRLNEIIIKTYPLENYNDELKSAILVEVLQKTGLSLFNRTEESANFQNRIVSLKKWNPDSEFPDLEDESLLNKAGDWFPIYSSNIKRKEDFYKIDFEKLLKDMLTWEQLQQLDKLVPDNILVPSGFKIPLQYFNDAKDPVLSVRLQEMFGLLETPVINNGKTKVLLHLLSPGYKPVQVTQDLKSFWKNTYPDVRKELRVKYQKHHWPEDPWTAEAVRGVKKRIV
ncbi:MAG: ATP-dependent helicase HrpB [Opitutaceae bacterium]|nr:ATP-dependent helicase HrpB [Cytophagales bacterium]